MFRPTGGLLVVFLCSALALRLAQRATWKLSMAQEESLKAWPQPKALSPPLQRPANTENEYEYLVLSNGIRVMLTSLPHSEKSSAALALSAGAQDDFEGLAGLAHFTEHAVFLGSHTYPVENAFKTFLSKNGGSSNGGTSMEYTSYQFVVNNAAFEETLDIWSHFFRDPLFTDDAIGREIMAVDAEDSKNRILDNRRMLQVLKDVITPSCAYKKFSTGNVRTLAGGDAVANAATLATQMKQFYAQFYRPDQMTLSLVGPQPLSELKELAMSKFSPIRPGAEVVAGASSAASSASPLCRNAEVSTYPGGVYPLITVGKTLRVRPVKDIRDISILIPLPPTRTLHEAPPTRLLATLISHKAPGSLFAYLQDRGWATAVSGGERTDYRDFCLFEIAVALTVEGLAHYTEVVEAVFGYLSTVEAASDTALLAAWDELKVMGSIDFGFQEKASAYELAPFLAKSMLELPPHRVLSSGWLLEQLDLPLLRSEFLSRLSPERALVVLRSQTFTDLPDDGAAAASRIITGEEGTVKSDELGSLYLEPWYQTAYALKPESPDTLARWVAARTSPQAAADKGLHLPAPNPYVSPELADLVQAQQPHKLKSSAPLELSFPLDHHNKAVSDGDTTIPRIRGWYSKDEAFNQPRFEVHVLLHSVGHSALARIGHPILNLASAIFQQAEARNLYSAGRAGLSQSFSVGSRGLGITVSGYSPKLPLLLKTVAEKVGSENYWRQLLSDDSIFEVCKERQLRSLRSWTKERPDSVADVVLAYLMQEDARWPEERVALAATSDRQTLLSAMNDVLKRARMTVYVHGDKGDEKMATECVESLQGLLGEEMPASEVLKHQAEFGWGLQDRVLRARLAPTSKANAHTEAWLDSFNSEDANSALVLHFQVALRSPQTSALTIMLATYLREPAFNELRTKRQLGYIVSTTASGYGSQDSSMRGLTFKVLSQRYGPREILAVVDEFIGSQLSVFDNLSQEDLDKRTAAVIRSLEDPPTSYSEEASNFWGAIVENQPFDWTELVIAELRKLKVEQLKEAFASRVAPNDHRRSVAILIESAAHKAQRGNQRDEAALTVENLTSLRDSFPFAS